MRFKKKLRAPDTKAHDILSPVIISGKVHPPVRANDAMLRERLLSQLDDIIATRLTLIKAFAGFGKTTLLKQIHDRLKERGTTVGWLRLDPSDNEKTKAVAYLAAAFGEVIPSINEQMSPYFSAVPALAIPDIIAALIAALQDNKSPIILLVDDYHSISDSGVHEAFEYFLVNMPLNVCCVVSSRTQPPWNLARIAETGPTETIDETAIRFDPDEVVKYLEIHHKIRQDGVRFQAFWKQADGWITAIKLAAISIRKAHSPSSVGSVLAGAENELFDYLADAVFSKLDIETQEFLLHTASLERLCPSLCDAVTGLGNAHIMLRKLLRENLFLERSNGKGDWYEYHSLFAQFLNKRLSEHAQIDSLDIHRKASFWFEVNQQPHAAAEHALAAGDPERKGALIEAAILSMVRSSQIAMATGWFESLPPEFSETKPNVLTPMAWSYFYSRRAEEAINLIARANHLLTHERENLSPADQANIPQFRTEVEIIQMEIDRVFAGKQPEMRRLAEIKSSLHNDWYFLRGYVELMYCFAHIRQDRLEAAFSAAMESIFHGRKAKNPFIWNTATAQLAIIRHIQGRNEDAMHICREAIEVTDDSLETPIPVLGHLHLLAAEIYLECYDSAKTRENLEKAISLAELGRSPDVNSEIEILRSLMIAVEEGEDAAVSRLFRHNITELSKSAQYSVERVRAYLAWFLAGTGDLDGSENLLRQLGVPIERSVPPPIVIDPTTEIAYLAACRFLLVSGKQKTAANWLRYLLRLAERSGRARSQVSINGLLAVAYHEMGQEDSALRYVRDMLRHGQEGGFIRSILSIGPEIVSLLYSYRKRLFDGSPLSEYDIVSISFVDRLLDASRTGNSPDRQLTNRGDQQVVKVRNNSGMFDKLTPRESQILELIASGKKNRDVARELLIAESSVRWHIRNLFSKLDVSNRTEASVKARSLKIIF